ncbi:hypothetical protein ACFOLC_10460 [Lysobacter cavernae]|uniref:Lectin n=1 Tax=Lysobacter cavernae TaxID=1685901 RepID=A0ABV7RPL9_9GAMM
MTGRIKLWLPTMLLALAACGGDRAGDAPSAAVPAPEQEQDAPVQDVPPATAPQTPGAMPAPGTIGFAGFGPARFGADQEQVRMAWGADLGDAKPAEPGGCYYLMPRPVPAGGYRIAFMIEHDKFARIDVESTDIIAPGGGKVGMSADEIGKLYAGRIQTRPHKYAEGGQYLRIQDAAAGNGVLLFETDAGKVTGWRIGVPPQIDYVEGCS